jgi:Zn-dependent protease with chaperone function
MFWVPLAVRYGFLSEVTLLEQLKGLRVGRRVEEILRNHFIEACGRYATIAHFAMALSVMLFLLLDLGSQFLFGFPIFVGKLSWAFAFEDGANLLMYDPLLVATLSATWWIVYPIARLSWFFCYLDARIRKEGWDLEIAFRVEARRLPQMEKVPA